MIKTATLSDCGRYRYRLGRAWDETLPRLGFVMLNPSTADADVDDPTIRKCMGFAERAGCGGIEVVNLFAWRATDPRALRAAGYPVGPLNIAAIADMLGAVPRVVCAWGANARGTIGQNQSELALSLIRARGRTPEVLRLLDDGTPAHPLMLPYACQPAPMWPIRS